MKKYKIKSSVKITLGLIILLIIIFSIKNINPSKSYSIEYNIKNYDIRLSAIVSVMVGFVVILSDWFTRITFWGGTRDNGW